MEISRKGIEWIYFNDRNFLERSNNSKYNYYFDKYAKALDELLKATAKDKMAEVKTALFFKLDEIDGERLSYIELEGYIKGFEMCMKLIGNETIKD